MLIEGRLNPDPATGGPRVWTRQDGTVGSSFEVTAHRVQFLSTRNEDNGYAQEEEPVEEEPIPF